MCSRKNPFQTGNIIQQDIESDVRLESYNQIMRLYVRPRFVKYALYKSNLVSSILMQNTQNT